MTLGLQHLRARTTAAVSPHFTRDRIWLNGVEQSVESSRLQTVFQEIRRRARKRHLDTAEHNDINKRLVWKIHICSENNFPTAAGLASSAAGLACLVFVLAKLFNIEGDVSDIARQGSGSACRSMYGGFVEWTVGSRDDGTDSIAQQIATEQHWPDMHVLILVVNAAKKHMGSTEAMQISVKTSKLLQYRADHIVPGVMSSMRDAILNRNFDQFAELTMKDSNQMHAVHLDTFPPVSYLTDTSHAVIRLVHALNKHFGRNLVAYTFDAGPNACLYLLEENVEMVLGILHHFFPSTNADNQVSVSGLSSKVSQPTEEILSHIPLQPIIGAIEYIIHTKIGHGPQVVHDPAAALLGGDGLPLTLKS